MTTTQSHLPVFAIIPAAGYSRRMGSAKQVIEINGRPMLQSVVDTLTASDVAGVMVITRRAIIDELGEKHFDRAHLVYNEDKKCEMIDSIRVGIRAWRERITSPKRDPRRTPHGPSRNMAGAPDLSNFGFLICPGDQPFLTTRDINACITRFRKAPDSIVIASFEGRRGHPIIFPAALAGLVLSPVCDRGLNILPQTLDNRLKLVLCNVGVIKDIDTPDDL